MFSPIIAVKVPPKYSHLIKYLHPKQSIPLVLVNHWATYVLAIHIKENPTTANATPPPLAYSHRLDF